jgi:peptidoglycan pentaglycine glycine transferase (the first glycine)
MTILTSLQWDQFLIPRSEAHLLQTSMWGDLKNQFGWQPVRLANSSAGAQVLFRRLPLGLSIAYIPKGPVGMNWDSLWPEVHSICMEKHSVFLRVEPDAEEPVNDRLMEQMGGFIPVGDTIQPRQTILVDLSGCPEEWLARMKQKTRYNTRLAEKKEICVTESQDFTAFERLMQTTGVRDGFGVHTLEYYRQAYSVFSQRGQVALLQAEFNKTPLAMLMVFAQGKRAFYLYGASGDEERQRMPVYLLQFEAMRWAASKNCDSYDLWGIPDASEEDLEAQFEGRSDGLWGVYRFKRGFGGRIVRACTGFDYVYQPLLYRTIRWQMLRSRGMTAG